MYSFGTQVPRYILQTVASVIAGLLLASCNSNSSVEMVPSHPLTPPEQRYIHDVAPILKANCYRCHSGLNRRGGFQMDTRTVLLEGGRDGIAVVPGHPENSMLIRLIRHEGTGPEPMPMPPKKKLSDQEIETITQWIRDGAAMPSCAEGIHICKIPAN